MFLIFLCVSGVNYLRFDMCGGIAFHVAVTVGKRHNLARFHDNVTDNVRIGIFVDCYLCGCGWGDVNNAHAIPYTGITYYALYIAVDVDELSSFTG